MPHDLIPPPSLVDLVKDDFQSDSTWKLWLNNLYEIVKENMSKDFFFEVAAGRVNGHTGKYVVGHAEGIGTTLHTVGCVTPGTGVEYVYPSAATIDYVSSDNAADTHDITIDGLDANFEPVAPYTVTLNGTTPVAIATPLRRVNYFYNASGTATTGTVYLWDSPSGNGTEHTAGVPTTATSVKAFIETSIGTHSNEHHMSSVFTIPANKTGYVVFGKTTVADATSKTMELSFWSRTDGQVLKQVHHIDIINTNYDYFFKLPAAMPEKTDLEVKATVSVGTADVAVHYDIILVDN